MTSVYVAGPMQAYRTQPYDDAVALAYRSFPSDCRIIDARTQYMDTPDWLAKWPKMVPSIGYVLFIADRDGFIGKGVLKEVEDVRAQGGQALFVHNGNATEAYEIGPANPNNWRQHCKVTAKEDTPMRITPPEGNEINLDMTLVLDRYKYHYNKAAGQVEITPNMQYWLAFPDEDFTDNFEMRSRAEIAIYLQGALNDPPTTPLERSRYATALLLYGVMQFNRVSNYADIAEVRVPGIELNVQPNDRWMEHNPYRESREHYLYRMAKAGVPFEDIGKVG